MRGSNAALGEGSSLLTATAGTSRSRTAPAPAAAAARGSPRRHPRGPRRGTAGTGVPHGQRERRGAGLSSAPRRLTARPPPAAAAAPAPTAEPVGGDVLQHGEGDAEEGDEEVAERQGADEYVGDGPHGFAAGHHVEHQAVAEERQGEDEHADEDEGQLGARRQLRDVHEGLQPVQGDELLPRHIVVPQELRELLRGDVQGPHGAVPAAARGAERPARPAPGAGGERGGARSAADGAARHRGAPVAGGGQRARSADAQRGPAPSGGRVPWGERCAASRSLGSRGHRPPGFSRS